MIRPPRSSTLFPYTTLFRSVGASKAMRLHPRHSWSLVPREAIALQEQLRSEVISEDRKSTRLNSSHANISYAVFCLKKKKTKELYSVRKTTTLCPSFIKY